jgi:hypothetical protein
LYSSSSSKTVFLVSSVNLFFSPTFLLFFPLLLLFGVPVGFRHALAA